MVNTNKSVIFLIRGVIFLLLTLVGITLQAQPKIQRIEPPNWWIGMENQTVQLLIYGKELGDLEPKIKTKGIEIQKVKRVENDNYLFIDLKIAKNTAPGKFNINFQKNGTRVLSKKYELKARTADAKSIKGFDNSDVLYLITPDRFANGDPSNDSVNNYKEKANRQFKGGRHGGDIEGIRQHLDYIRDMGFTAIWLNPLLENDQPEYSYHGYATTDFYKVDERFGTNEAYKKLCEEANKKGIKVIMDMIVNHSGDKHWWMKDLPTGDWLNSNKNYIQTNHRKTVLQDPYVAKIDKKIFTDGWFVPTMPDLNQRNPLMATYLTQMSIWWIEYAKISGIRMDTYSYPDAEYMSDWTQDVMTEYPNFNIVGEEWFEGSPAIIAFWQKGKTNPNGYTSALKSLMDFPLRASLTKALNAKENWGEGWINLYETLAYDFLYANPNDLVIFPDNHDMTRFYKQVNEDFDLFKLGLTFIATTRGIPQLYYGTEILMTSPLDRDDGIIRSDFPGGWAGDEVNAFTGARLSEKQKKAQDFVRNLLNWRKTASEIHTGNLVHFVPQDGVYVYFRFDENRKTMVILNKNEKPYELKTDRFEEQLRGFNLGKDILSNKTFEIQKNLKLSPVSALILELE